MEYLPTFPSGRRKTPLLALLSLLIVSTLLLGAGAAHAGQDKSPPQSSQALALQWFDVSKEPIAAALEGACGCDPADRPGAARGNRLGVAGRGDRLLADVEPLQRQRLA